ncbi:zinc metalloproteinase/disintegrin-like [Mercenaria mercenaria]|uniref:zinc metalloproteinase/disintegrin-like n=1 Tax=Mercenaria mercenaria TaxID=6596 RepID=UPI00234E9B06|nr:zinc metalloproteinase/disintegrin-like [Mercenaria mercenaria]
MLNVCIFATIFVNVVGLNSYVLAQSEPVAVTIRDAGTNGEFRGNQASMPDWMQITLHRADENVSLLMERNRNIQSDVPISVHRNGRLIYQDINDTEAVGYYLSLEPYATVMATKVKEHVSSTLKLTGDVKLQNVTYRLEYHDNTQEYRLSMLGERSFRRNDFVIRSDSNMTEITEPDFNDFLKEEERINKQLYEIEVLAVADFSQYKFWLDVVSNTFTNMPFIYRDMIAKEKLRQYIAFVLNGVDLRYRSITTRNFNIRILFTGLYLADIKESSPWTENSKHQLTGGIQVDSDTVLSTFSDWSEEFKAYLPDHDHAMLFTKYDITRNENGSLNTGIVGLSSVGDICLANRQSVIEDKFGEDVSLTAAHELGHNLGADHDGQHEFCLEEDGYIMSPVIRHDKPSHRNHWKFSACSQYYFFRNINDLNRLGLNCMSTRGNDINLLSEYNNKLPGQIYGPDEQCEYMYGKGSYLFRYAYKLNYTSICSTLKCVDPDEKSYHFITDTMDGTPCGKGKLCHGGYCVEDARASTDIKDECPFGDSPEIYHGSRTKCSDILYEPQWDAYINCQSNRYSCCETCSNLSFLPAMPTSTTKNQPESRQPLVGECITSCKGVRDGEYQSCRGCHVYASCNDNVLMDGRPCQRKLLWSDDLKRCEYSSNTC